MSPHSLVEASQEVLGSPRWIWTSLILSGTETIGATSWLICATCESEIPKTSYKFGSAAGAEEIKLFSVGCWLFCDKAAFFSACLVPFPYTIVVWGMSMCSINLVRIWNQFQDIRKLYSFFNCSSYYLLSIRANIFNLEHDNKIIIIKQIENHSTWI